MIREDAKMKKSLKIAVIFLIMFCVFCGGASAQLSDSLKSGKDKNGEFVMPRVLAVECDVAVNDSSAGVKMDKCFRKLLKDRSNDADESKRIDELWRDAIDESRKGSLIIALQTKMYAADYEEDIVKEFEKNMSDSAPLGMGAGGGDAGGAEAAGIREDWQNIAVSDAHIAEYVNSWLNKFMASTVMHKALTALNDMDSDYLGE